MAEYIEREELKKVFSNEAVHCLTFQKKGEARGLIKAREIVSKLPTADVAEVKHSKWLKDDNGNFCSNCMAGVKDQNNKPFKILDFNYCPNCGAKMDGRRESNAE
ncbi:MAG: hypothetical protein IJ370_09140 [Oscillospiraceae bacterium]|nr:hypothetical protein [Oscillospiraceae bacterium]MBQ8338567.1 hypothetical protein [Oscillospiraceae bacterium]